MNPFSFALMLSMDEMVGGKKATFRRLLAHVLLWVPCPRDAALSSVLFASYPLVF